MFADDLRPDGARPPPAPSNFLLDPSRSGDAAGGGESDNRRAHVHAGKAHVTASTCSAVFESY